MRGSWEEKMKHKCSVCKKDVVAHDEEMFNKCRIEVEYDVS